MSGPFGSLDTAASGMSAHGRWLDVIANNIANVSTGAAEGAEPFRASHPIFSERDGGGVDVTGVQADEGDPALVGEAGGERAMPVVDLGAEMVDMIVATRGYQASASAARTARERYESALRIGR